MLTAGDVARDISAISGSCGCSASPAPAMQLGFEGLAVLRGRDGGTLNNGVVAVEGYDPQGLLPVPFLMHPS